MRQNIQIKYRNSNINPNQTSRHNYTYSNPNLSQNQTYQTTNNYTRLPLRNQIQTTRNGINPSHTISTQVSIASPNTSQQGVQIHVTRNITQINNPQKESNLNEMNRNRQTNILVNKNNEMLNSQNTNSSNNSFQNLMNKKSNYKNISRNIVKNLKFKIDIKPNESRANDIRNKRIEDSNRGEHLRAKSYNTEREGMKNYLPKQADDQKRISHSVEVKRRTINRGDKYNNIQITHIISTSKPALEKTEFHIFEKLSTVELEQKPLDLSKIKLYIKKDPSAKSNYFSSCSKVPLKSAEKTTKTIHYQHAGGMGMTNLKSNNINTKYYQSNIVTLPLKETKMQTPIVKFINEFRCENPKSFRNNSFGEKLSSTYIFNKNTYSLNTDKEKTSNNNIIKSNYQTYKEKEIEEKNKMNKNYKDINDKKHILPLTTRGNGYNTKTYTNTRNYNNINKKQDIKTDEKKPIMIIKMTLHLEINQKYFHHLRIKKKKI